MFCPKPDGGFVNKISMEPLNAALHLQYAVYALKRSRPYLALAELKTAEYLGASDGEIQKYRNTIIASMPQPEILDHNQYFRFKTLSSELNSRSDERDYSVLDVGGGQGQLASFIPEASYCLAEPGVNGISGTNLPFPDRSFDYVVSCHVLEHIPVENRKLFLDQLLSKSRYGLILLNPFHVEGSHVEDRLELVIDVTGAAWAKEHLECTLPHLEYIKQYAKEKKLEVNIRPNGTLTTTMALVFVDYFARKSWSKPDLDKINKFFNMKFGDILDSENYPTGYLVYLGWPEARAA